MTTGQGEDFTHRCLIDYEYYRLIANNLSRQKILDAGPKPTQKLEPARSLKNKMDDADGSQSMFNLTI